jgi:pimeloyl-ACP methyl ester carboxylesterase
MVELAGITHTTIVTNGIKLHVVQAGPEDGQPVILLHGFPEIWYCWRHQIGYLAERGFRVIVPDQRGYNLSDKPAGVPAYNLDELAADVIGLIDSTGHERAYLVGHDWGGAVAWWVANKYPQRLKKLVNLNIPHHAVIRRALNTSWAQRRKSWYMLTMQIPWLPEQMTARGDYRALAQALLGSSTPGAFTEADLEKYREAWSQPGAVSGMLNWYRALFRFPPGRLDSPRITVPTLLIWGRHDVALGVEMAQPSIDLCDDGRLVLLDEASHWVQNDEPDRVNALIGEFFEI